MTAGETATARPTRLAASFADFVGAMTREEDRRPPARPRSRPSASASAGVREVHRTLPLGNTGGVPASWTGWGTKAPDRARAAGSIVVAKDESGQARVGLLTSAPPGRHRARPAVPRATEPASASTR